MIRPIQCLRGIAAIMVVWHHARTQLPGLEQALPWSFGTSGVDLFFVISGFIMVTATAGRDVRPLEFLLRRAIRVVPLYWGITLLMVCAALVAPALFRSIDPSPDHVLLSLLFVPHWSPSFPGVAWPVLVPGWTLNFEMAFYAIFAASLLTPSRHALLAAIGLLVGLGLALKPAGAALQTYTSPMMLEFALGVVIALYWQRFRVSAVAAAAALAHGAVLLALRDTWGIVPQVIGAGLVVFGALHFDWRNRLLLVLGDASYSVYLTHLFTLGVLRVVLKDPVAFMPAALVACSAVGWLSYRLVEVPTLRWLGHLTVRLPKSESASSAPQS
jgi:exopolysaccharide production protein ExoZ